MNAPGAHPAEPSATEQLLHQRATLPDGHPHRATLRDQAIEASLPLARHLARRYMRSGDADDLEQVAALALIRAVDGFDPAYGVPFSGYAIPSILGALKRHFRDTSWGMRVGRTAQELILAVGGAAGELSHRLGRSPTAAELAERLGVDVDDVIAAIAAAQAYHLTSLDTPHAGPDSTLLVDHVGAVDPGYRAVDDRLTLWPLVSGLAPREQRIIAMRFGDRMTQAQIGAVIGVSQMQVSRLLAQSLERLRAGLG